ncbi:hypothetical protein Asulf_01281 [Archaeoglobus sulfaticallidus PM70-1]|uniref:ABC-type cobalt transport system, permease component CbiQ-related transporter n=1 Tax=Archaeoglobus sulfaticallidus PM70-1 TaxID=387631 RepID=N0BLZ0_9EURY|nr:hypothetical protein [Archaeoglobus sulfaticallidus]AGK61275.1 hypothetical protein Asulf_01281 [Archaeoglobus sulfaticallidus PM70-1]
MIAGIFRRFERFTSSGNDVLDARVAMLFILFCVVLMGFNFTLSMFTATILLCSLYLALTSNLNRLINSLYFALPFIAFFSVSTLLLTSNAYGAMLNALYILSLLSLSSIMLSIPSKNILMALRFFRLPERYALMVLIALRLVNIYTRDLINIIELYSVNRDYKNKLDFYRKIVKAFVSILILRALSVSEAIYMRDINLALEREQKFGWREAYLILASAVLFCLAVFSFFLNISINN